MSNPTIETILARSSYRGEYQNIPVPREDLIAIMEAGLAAPSGCNQQTTSIIAIDDPAVLADRCKEDHHPSQSSIRTGIDLRAYSGNRLLSRQFLPRTGLRCSYPEYAVSYEIFGL